MFQKEAFCMRCMNNISPITYFDYQPQGSRKVYEGGTTLMCSGKTDRQSRCTTYAVVHEFYDVDTNTIGVFLYQETGSKTRKQTPYFSFIGLLLSLILSAIYNFRTSSDFKNSLV